MAPGAAVASLGEPDADFAGFAGADGDVAGESFLPVAPGLDQVAVSVVAVGETVVRAGLPPWRVGLGCEPQSGGVVLACLIGITSPEENVSKTVERVGLQKPGADLAEHCQGLLQVPGSLLAAAELQVNAAEQEQDLGFAGPVAHVMEQG